MNGPTKWPGIEITSELNQLHRSERRVVVNRRPFLSHNYAIDLGTVNTLLYARDQGIVLDEPSLLAVDHRTGRPIAVGAGAKRMVGRTPASIEVVRPLRDGAIADLPAAEAMLRLFLKRAGRHRLERGRLLVCVPSGVSAVEKRAVRQVVENLSAHRPALIMDEPMAAALGSGLPVARCVGSMVVEIGGATTEVAVITMGGIAASCSIRVGGDEFDQAVISLARRKYGIEIGPRRAEQLKIDIGSLWPLHRPKSASLYGRSVTSGLPTGVTVGDAELRDAFAEPFATVLGAVTHTLERTAPDLAADVEHYGIMLTGGGSLLRGFARRLGADTGLRVTRAPAPLRSVAVGSGRCLDHPEGWGLDLR